MKLIRLILKSFVGLYYTIRRTPIGRVVKPAVNISSFVIYVIAAILNRFHTEQYGKEGVAILYYHEIEPQQFEKHLKFICKHRNIIPLDALCERIESRQNIENFVVITFDDGFKSNVKLLPTIKKYNVPITLYLTSDVIGTSREFWWVTVKNLAATAVARRVSDVVIHEPEYYSRIPQRQKNEEISSATAKLQYRPKERCALSLREIEQMIQSGLITIGSHSKSHPCLNMTSNEEAEEEIFGSKKDLEARLSVKVNHFSFPNGDYEEKHIQMVKKAGYRSSATTIPELNTSGTSLFKLRRICVGTGWSKWTLGCNIFGLWDRIGLYQFGKARLRARGVQF